jgi:excisionase family DNA binding protein
VSNQIGVSMDNSNPLRLTKSQAAQILGLALRTIDTRIAEGKLAVVRDGRRVFILSDEVERYAKSGSQ